MSGCESDTTRFDLWTTILVIHVAPLWGLGSRLWDLVSGSCLEC